MKLSLKNKTKSNDSARSGQEAASTDLSKLKKKELLEIMLRQGEEIDALRAQNAELKAKLDKQDFDLSRIGSIAEASLVVTNIFEEAQKAAVIYLKNVKRMAEAGERNDKSKE